MQIKTVLDIPPQIAQGLTTGIYSRSGGTVRDIQTGQIVALLRDIAPKPDLLSMAVPVLGILNLGASVLNLGISVAGFSIVLERVNRLEKELQNIKAILSKFNQELSHKIDLSFYANFAAALKLAQLGFTMSDAENRKTSAFQAINRFLEAEEIYYSCAQNLLDSKTRGVEQYLFSLALAYVTEVRCYLELGEIGSAQVRFWETSHAFRSLVEAYVRILLTSNPAVYLQAELENEVSLTRFTQVIRWLKQDESIDENGVFQRHRRRIFSLHREFDQWKNSLPDLIWAEIQYRGNPATYGQFGKIMNKIEVMIETYERLESYGQEIQIMQQLGLSFQEWLQLPMPTLSGAKQPQVMCILVPERIDVDNR